MRVLQCVTVCVIVVAFASTGCHDESTSSSSEKDIGRGLAPDQDALLPDIQLIVPDPPPEPDMSVEEMCALTPPSRVQEYCSCYPQCCDVQRWYCPPNADQTVDVTNVTVEVCDENKQRCRYGLDPECPPPEILERSMCETLWECIPGAAEEYAHWLDCQLEDGTMGRQKVICDKGSIRRTPCIPCLEESCDGEDNDCDDQVDEGFFPCENECGAGMGVCVDAQIVNCVGAMPGEERCNYVDDDCDGQVDENQTNVCGTCGPVPQEECNGQDDDCDGQTDESLIRECETLCGSGIESCSAGNWISCSAVQPVEEECNGADDDCDGQIDEQLNCLCTIEDVGELQPCSEPPLLCGQGFKMCECANEDCTEMRMTDCQAICAYFPPAPPAVCDVRAGIALAQEACNNFDEDCDQDIDENLTQQCYTGEVETLGVGLCVPGEVYCLQGTWGNDNNGMFEPGLCLGEVTPQNEICDNQDNDCDGVTDYGDEIRDTDILFIVDWSGSMDDEINAVRTALNRFSQHYSNEEALQWGLIVGPKQIHGVRGELLIKVSDIAPFDMFLQSFAALGNEGMATGAEMLRDAIYLAIQNITGAADVDIENTEWAGTTGSLPEKEEFVINWRQNSDRIVIVFTDEEPQTFLRPGITDEIVISAIQSALNLKFYAFVPPHWAGDQWQDIIDVGNGSRFRLTDNPTIMYNDLMSIIDEACLPREENEIQDARIDHRNNRNWFEEVYLPVYREGDIRFTSVPAFFYYDTVQLYCAEPPR